MAILLTYDPRPPGDAKARKEESTAQSGSYTRPYTVINVSKLHTL
jgi:hypothetical protein